MLLFVHIRNSCQWAGKLAKATLKASLNRLRKRLGSDCIPAQMYMSGPGHWWVAFPLRWVAFPPRWAQWWLWVEASLLLL